MANQAVKNIENNKRFWEKSEEPRWYVKNKA